MPHQKKTFYRQIFSDYPDAVGFEQYRQMLGLGKNKAYEILQSGKIPYRRNGKKYIIAKMHIIDYLLGSDAETGRENDRNDV